MTERRAFGASGAVFVDVAVHVDGGGRGTGTRLRRGSSEPAFDRVE